MVWHAPCAESFANLQPGKYLQCPNRRCQIAVHTTSLKHPSQSLFRKKDSDAERLIIARTCVESEVPEHSYIADFHRELDKVAKRKDIREMLEWLKLDIKPSEAFCKQLMQLSKIDNNLNLILKSHTLKPLPLPENLITQLMQADQKLHLNVKYPDKNKVESDTRVPSEPKPSTSYDENWIRPGNETGRELTTDELSIEAENERSLKLALQMSLTDYQEPEEITLKPGCSEQRATSSKADEHENVKNNIEYNPTSVANMLRCAIDENKPEVAARYINHQQSGLNLTLVFAKQQSLLLTEDNVTAPDRWQELIDKHDRWLLEHSCEEQKPKNVQSSIGSSTASTPTRSRKISDKVAATLYQALLQAAESNDPNKAEELIDMGAAPNMIAFTIGKDNAAKSNDPEKVAKWFRLAAPMLPNDKPATSDEYDEE